MKMSLSRASIAKRLPLLRGFTHQVSPYFTGSLIENRLGAQVFRMVGKHVSWKLRKRRSTTTLGKSFADILERDGVLAIPDFLPREDFLEILNEVERAEPEVPFKSFRDAERGKLSVARIHLNDDGDDFPAVRKHLQMNSLILELVSAVIRRVPTSPPPVLISIYRRQDPTAPDNDIENVLHADLHAPTVKVFYYLNDIDEENGAFIYAKGSHKFSLMRLRHEYNISIRQAKLTKNGKKSIPDLIAVRGAYRRAVIAPQHQVGMNIRESHMCGKANTLIITNNMGFHRRGEFTSDRPRKTVLINFRHLEHCF